MLIPMLPQDAGFLLAESREHPMHVGSLNLFRPPDGMDAFEVRRMFQERLEGGEVGPLFRKRARRSITTLGQWGWEDDRDLDVEHHVRFNALPQPGRVLELLSLTSRLHSTLLDRHRPLWEIHLIEGLNDGRFAMYGKLHHALIDGVSGARLIAKTLSTNPDERGMAAPWEYRPKRRESEADPFAPVVDRVRSIAANAFGVAADVAGLVPAFYDNLGRAMRDQGAAFSFSAPKTMFNTRITGSRRFAAQSWDIPRLRAVGKSYGATLNDVVLAMSAGALRRYLISQNALPDEPLIAMVPVSLRDAASTREAGNAVGLVMCNLGTHLADPAERLNWIVGSMREGKQALSQMSSMQIIAMSALGLGPMVMMPALGLDGLVRPPFNVVISNVPGPKQRLYWNGSELDHAYPLSIPLDGMALNITCTSYVDSIEFGLIGCRRTVPHLQRLLDHLEEELAALEEAAGAAKPRRRRTASSA